MDKLSEKIQRITNAIKHPDVSRQMDESREVIYEKVNNKIDADSLSLKPANKPTLYIRYLSIASIAIIFIVSVTFLTYHMGYRSGINNLAQTYVQTKVPYGTVTSITLPDGTAVVLNSGSELTYPTYFDNDRQILLSGEAYFDVVKDAAKPFIVHTDRLSAKVLGTRFGFKAYKDDAQTTLTLESGSVSVLPFDDDEEEIRIEADEQVILDKETKMLQRRIVNSKDYISWKEAKLLEPNDQFTCDKKTGKTLTKKVKPEEYTSWKDGILTFRDLTLEEISVILERRFNVHINIESDNIRNERYGAQFKFGENVEQILDKLSFKRSWAYKMQDGIINIKNK